jgi:hypothetical protein
VPEQAPQSYEAVELRLAERSTDLWAAVEAAQYARAVTWDDPESAAEEAAMARFLQALATLAESWDAVPAHAKAAALDGLARHLAELRRAGLFVHCGTIERDFAAPGASPRPLPLAVLHLGHAQLPALTIMLPPSLDVTA